MIFVRRTDEIAVLPLAENTLHGLRRMGINSVGELFDAPGRVLERFKQAERMVCRMAEGDGPVGLLEWGMVLPGRRGTLYWSLEDGVLTVYGDGRMMDYNREVRPPWEPLKAQIRQVRLEEQVANVGAMAFSGCTQLGQAVLSQAVKRIGMGAFRDCGALERVESPRAFCHWRSPEADDTKVCVGQGAFSGTPLRMGSPGDFEIFDGVLVEYYGTERDVTIPAGVRQIAPMVFEGMPLTAVTLPKTLETIGACAFRGTALVTLELPKSVEQVQEWAFAGIPTLEQVVVRNAKMAAAGNAFAGTPVAVSARPVKGRWRPLYGLNPVEVPGINCAKALRCGPCPGVKIGVPQFATRGAFEKRLNAGEMLLQIRLDTTQKRVEWLRAYYLHRFNGWMRMTFYPCRDRDGMVSIWRDETEYLSDWELHHCSLAGLRKPGKSVWYTTPYQRYSEYDKPVILLQQWVDANPGYDVESLESCFEADRDRLLDAC